MTNLTSPDIISVEEIQDNDGATDDGVVAADQTLTKLTAAIVAAGGPATSGRRSTRSTTPTAASRAATSGWCSCTTPTG